MNKKPILQTKRLHMRKMIAPIVITVIILFYYIGFALVLTIMEDIPMIAKLLGGIIPLILAGVVIYILVERIKEIKNGEEDDLSQY